MTTKPGVALHHVGIWVTDFDMMVALYRRIFGFHMSDLGNYDAARLSVTHDMSGLSNI